jgi:ABC-2 type transport system ATP-binding protein
VNDILNFFELSARGNDKVETYSKGMKQRLALARALIHKPPLLFLDEPTSGLDPEAAQQVDDLIASLRQTDGQTVVLATHNLLEAQRLCDRVAIINNGRILAMGSLDELSKKLWPAKWVDIKFYTPPTKNVEASLKINRGVMQATAANNTLSVQVESDEVIPALVRQLIEQGESILKVNPRDYTLEDIYFALQAGEA